VTIKEWSIEIMFSILNLGLAEVNKLIFINFMAVSASSIAKHYALPFFQSEDDFFRDNPYRLQVIGSRY